MQPFPSFAKREVLKNLNIFFRAPTWSISPTNSWSSPSVGAQPNVRITCTCQKSCCSKSPKEKLVLLTKNQTNDRFTFSFQKFVKIGHLPKLNSGDGAATIPEHRKLEKRTLSDFCNNLLLSPVKEWKDVFVLRKFLFGQPLTSLNSRLILKSHWDLAIKAWYMLSVAGSYINEKDEFCMCRILAFEY